ncbi:MAG: alanine--tRNA ligase, partial [Acidiferrobacterales bacterium]
MKSTDIRQLFLDYFKRQDHQIVASSPLVPANDPTLLFTNAGMVQFKDVFLGSDKRSYKRAVTAQRCLRVGGKHNDLENVGYTARHHTFFEMLGNFSFGDYFKRDAIGFAWELMTQDMGLPPDKLWVTIYEDDDEAADVWLNEIGVPKKHFARMGTDSNFWAMGDTGPCGPCSEIFYDHGPEVAGGPPGSPDEDGDRYVEIWNLVFMQFNRDEQGTLDPLPRPSVDTGMGLERIAAVLQGVHSNYDIDLFQHLMQAAAEIAGIEDTDNNSLRVVADHIRACAFLVADGVVPSNEGRGYVLRRIIRRAARHGHELGLREPFFYKLVGPLDKEMGQAYPELPKARKQIEHVLKQEETRFAETLEQGMKILEQSLANLSGKQLSGETAFKLYDTYGFPLDLTVDYAREHGVTVDIGGYESAMATQRERARGASSFTPSTGRLNFKGHTPTVTTDFRGYETTKIRPIRSPSTNR